MNRQPKIDGMYRFLGLRFHGRRRLKGVRRQVVEVSVWSGEVELIKVRLSRRAGYGVFDAPSPYNSNRPLRVETKPRLTRVWSPEGGLDLYDDLSTVH